MIDIRHGDCLELLRDLPDGSVSAVITDPPYGIRYANKRNDIRPNARLSGMIHGDDSNIGQQVIDKCFSREWPVCAFAHHRNPWQGKWRQWLVWDKGPTVGGGDIATCWKFTWEIVQVGGFGRLNGKRDGGVLKFHVGQRDFQHHPTQKPVSLMRYLICKLTKLGDTILDPFGGSGSTAVACALEGRNCILMEREAEYVAIARRRVAEAESKAGLFTEPV